MKPARPVPRTNFSRLNYYFEKKFVERKFSLILLYKPKTPKNATQKKPYYLGCDFIHRP